MGDSTPAKEDSEKEMRDLAGRLDKAEGEGQFNNAVLTFASRRQLRVYVYDRASHTYPTEEVITVSYEPEKPMSVTVAD